MSSVLPAPSSRLEPAIFAACLTSILTTRIVGRFTVTMYPEIPFGA